MELMIEDLMEQLVKEAEAISTSPADNRPTAASAANCEPMQEEPLSEEGCNRLIFSMLNNSQRKTLNKRGSWIVPMA